MRGEGRGCVDPRISAHSHEGCSRGLLHAGKGILAFIGLSNKPGQMRPPACGKQGPDLVVHQRGQLKSGSQLRRVSRPRFEDRTIPGLMGNGPIPASFVVCWFSMEEPC